MTTEQRPVEESEGASALGLFLTLVALMLLAGTSLVFRFAHLGVAAMPVAMGIAALKALLVALVFMELIYEKPTIRFVIAAGFMLITIMLSLMIGDVITRAAPPLQNPAGTEPRALG